MASSGSKSVSFTQWDDLKFSWWISSQSVEDNSSVVSWKIELVSGKYGQIVATSQSAWSITVNGTQYTGKENIGIGNNATKTLASGSTTIAHNADGTKSFSYSFSQEMYIKFSGESIHIVSGSGSGTLDTIARASQPSLVTWPDTTNDVGDFGEEFSIHMNTASQSFKHTVRYEYGDRKGTIATNVVNGTTWAVPLEFMNDIPNATSASGRIYVDTYSGSTLVGTKYTGFTVTVPSSVKPGVSFTLEDITGIDEIYGSPVKGLSKIKITVNATLAYGSPIASYTITANGGNYSSSPATTGYLSTSGTSKVTATVKDKRGRSNSHSYDMNVQNYAAPSVSALSVHRCNEDGTANDQGGYVKATFSATVSSMNSKNTALYKLKYKKSSETSYTTITLSDLTNKYSASSYSYIFEADSNSSYDVEITAQDRHATASRSTSASTAFTLMNFNPQGNGIGIGQVCEKQNTLQINLDVEFKGKSIVDIVYPVGSIYLAYNHTNPGTLFPGTTWTRIYGAFPWFTDANGAIGLTGGERTVTLTANQIPAHNHGGTYTNAGTARTHAWLASGGSAMGFDTVNAGGGEAHNNMPPYIQISAWRRTA
jgi:hypothetical protein